MQLPSRILILFCFLLGFGSALSQGTDYYKSIYKIHATTKDISKSKTSTGFAYIHQNGRKGILLTLHSLCDCDTYTATEVKLKNGRLQSNASNVYTGFSIAYVDWGRDVAFIESPQFKPESVFRIPSSKVDISNVDLYGFGFDEKYELLSSGKLELDKVNTNMLTFGELCSSYKIQLNTNMSISNTKILKLENNGMVRHGWSGGPILAFDKDKNLVGIINGGLTERISLPIIFGFELKDLKLAAFNKDEFSRKCKDISQNLMYSGTEEERNQQIKDKLNYIIEKKEFDSYYKYLYARPKGSSEDDTPETLVLNANGIGNDTTHYPEVIFSRHLQAIHERKNLNKRIKVAVKATFDIENQINLLVDINGNKTSIVHTSTMDNGYRHWNYTDLLVEVIDFDKWVKLIFLSLDARQINENEVQIVMYEKGQAPKQKIRKSYISYPEAKKEDLVLQK